MKKFLLHVTLFSVLPIAACVWIGLKEPDREAMWTNSPEDCDGRGAFIYNRIFKSELPIDVAFLGSSHTINGINDTLIERIIKSDTLAARNRNVVNLGYCRFGPELNLIIARDLFTYKQPHVVYIEIGETMSTASHPMYPYFATKKDLYTPPSWVNQRILLNIYDGFLARLTYFRKGVFAINDSTAHNTPDYGYRGYPDACDPDLLIGPESPSKKGSSAIRSLETSYSMAWLRATVDFCKSNGAKVAFVYVPSFHDQSKPVEGMEFYESLAPVLIADRSIVERKEQWRDPDHFNNSGAQSFSEWLATSLLNR